MSHSTFCSVPEIHSHIDSVDSEVALFRFSTFHSQPWKPVYDSAYKSILKLFCQTPTKWSWWWPF